MAQILQTKRIQNIINLCPKVKTVLDVGCDHGNVTAGILLGGKASRVIATDISKDSLNKAILLAQKLNILPYISFREGGGLQNVTRYDNVDCAIIGGLGGFKIIEILESKKITFKHLVLQPMGDEIELREWLLRHKYKIEIDYMFEDGGQYYNLIYAMKGSNKKFSPIYYIYGKDNFKGNQDFINYLKIEEAKILTIYDHNHKLSTTLTEKYDYITEALSMLGLETQPLEFVQEQEYYDENGNTYYIDDNGQAYYLDDNNVPYYLDSNGLPYYIDENGKPYFYSDDGEKVYFGDETDNQGEE